MSCIITYKGQKYLIDYIILKIMLQKENSAYEKRKINC